VTTILIWIRRSDVLKDVLKFPFFSVLKIKIFCAQACCSKFLQCLHKCINFSVDRSIFTIPMGCSRIKYLTVSFAVDGGIHVVIEVSSADADLVLMTWLLARSHLVDFRKPVLLLMFVQLMNIPVVTADRLDCIIWRLLKDTVSEGFYDARASALILLLGLKVCANDRNELNWTEVGVQLTCV